MERRLFLSFPLMAAGLRAAPSKPGILLLAHGGRVESWNEEVNRIAAEVNRSWPTEVAFGMATRSSIEAAAGKLIEKGVSRIVAVPLFISSHSSVIRSTEWLLGLRDEMPEDYKVFASMSHGHGSHGSHGAAPAAGDTMKPLKLKVPVTMTPAIDRHPIAADILLDRAGAISRNPSKEVVVLVAHGPNPEDDNEKWLADLGVLAALMRKRAKFSRIEYLTVRDDAGNEVREKAKAELRGLVEKAANEGNAALVVPVLLSYGGIENGIRKRLEGLQYTMAAQGLLPDERLARWVLESVQSATPSH
jgi:sirohydrochlorin ferrochelatase